MGKIVHAILIDVAARAIKVVQLGEDHLKSAYQLIGCDMIEAATRLLNGDVVYVDEEALVKFNPPKGSFMFQGRVFKGNGLIVNESGEDWTAPHSSVIQLFQSIVLEEPKKVAKPDFGPDDLLLAMTQGKFKPMSKNDYDSFAGAKEGSVICYDMRGWFVIISPGDAFYLDKEALSVRAYLFPSVEADSYELTINDWSEILPSINNGEFR